MKIDHSRTSVKYQPEHVDFEMDKGKKETIAAEERNFEDRINSVYSTESLENDGNTSIKSKESANDEYGNSLFTKTVWRNGCIEYTMDNAWGNGKTTFKDYDGDGSPDGLVVEYETATNLVAIDNNDDGEFDEAAYIYTPKTKASQTPEKLEKFAAENLSVGGIIGKIGSKVIELLNPKNNNI